VLAIYLVAQYNRPNAVDWSETYNSNDKIPFGTYVLYNRLNDVFPKAKIETFREPAYNVFSDHDISNGAYLIVSSSVNFNEYDFKKLKTFIKNGNDVFISAAYFGAQIKKELHIETGLKVQAIKTSGKVRFTNPHFDTNKTYRLGKGIGGIYFENIDTEKAIVLGTDEYRNPNFIKYAMGKGNLYLNANPLMFTNYSMFNNQGVEYVAIALSYVKNDKFLMWDQYYSQGREDDGSEMRVFLRHPALRWAFYIAIFSLVLFVLYEIKRRQRIIPVIKPLENATLSFVNVVGQVYYERHDNLNIANKKVLYFLERLRSGYNLKTNPLDQEFIDSLARKTGIEPAFAKTLIDYFIFLGNNSFITNKELIELNRLIEQFYNQAR